MIDPTPINPRPLPVHRDHHAPDGEDLYVLACNARRDAGDITFANILRLERKIETLHANMSWRRKYASTRTGRWITSRMMVLLVVSAAVTGSVLWLRYTEEGTAGRIGFIEGSAASTHANPWLEPHWLTADLSQRQIDSLIRAYNAQAARKLVQHP